MRIQLCKAIPRKNVTIESFLISLSLFSIADLNWNADCRFVVVLNWIVVLNYNGTFAADYFLSLSFFFTSDNYLSTILKSFTDIVSTLHIETFSQLLQAEYSLTSIRNLAIIIVFFLSIVIDFKRNFSKYYFNYCK